MYESEKSVAPATTSPGRLSFSGSSACARRGIETAATNAAAERIFSILDMRPPSDDAHGPSIRVESRIPNLLIVDGDPRERAEVQAVEELDGTFRRLVDLPVAD